MKQFPTKGDPYMMDSNKLLWSMERVLAWERGERIAPLLIDIGVTKACNIQCRYCYGIYQKPDNTFIPRKHLVKLFRDAPRLGIKALTLTGDGEPTLNLATYEACQVGKANGLDIGVATNAVALNDDKIKILLDTSVWIRINLSASNRDSYKLIHGADWFHRVIGNTERMMMLRKQLELKTTVGFQMVLTPDCLNDVIPLAKRAVDLGLDYFVVKQFSDPGQSIPCRGYDYEEFERVAVPILKAAEGMSNDVTKVIVKWNLIGSKNRRNYDNCIDCAFIFQISGNGKCYPCGYLFGNNRYCYGDITKQTLEEIITSEHYWKIINHMRYKFDVYKECHGNCRHDMCNLFLHKYLNKPEHLNFI